jgi:hypothetical protein
MSDLDDELDRYRTLAFLAGRAKELALSKPSDKYVLDLGIPGLGKQRADEKATIKAYFDSVEKSLFEQGLLRLVAAFERLAYEKLKNAIGTARKTLREKYPPQSPFARVASHFVKDTNVGFKYLADVGKLFAKYPKSASKDLVELRSHRNWIAHGGRVGKPSTFSKIEDVHKALADLLSVIETK